MSLSEQKTFLMMYKSQIERELASLQTIFNEHNIVILPESITGHTLYTLSIDYIKSIETAIQFNKQYLQQINKKLQELS